MKLATKGTETERLFELLCNKAPVGVSIIQDGKFCYINPTFQRNTGYSEDELLGRDSLEIVVPEDREMVKENAIKTLKGKLTLPYEFRVVHKDGSIHWVVESLASIEYRGRQATLASFVDTTERKQAEEALQAEKNKLQTLIDAMSDALNIIDTDYTILYQNEPSKKPVGGDHAGEKCYQVFEGREKVCEGCPVREAFKDGKSHTSERMTVISGEVAFWENTACPIRDARGRIVACVEIARNITQRKQMEEALQAEKNKLQSLIDAMEDALTIQDREYNIIFQNEVSKRSTAGDRTGQKCYRVFEGEDKVCDGCPVEKAFKDGKTHVAERMRTLPSGEVTFWENTASPVRDGDGNIVACLEVGRNITERKKMEQALADEVTRRRILIDQSLDGIVVLDEDAAVVEANQRFAEMLGYTLEEVRELHTWDWDKQFPPEKLLEMGRAVDEKGFHLETKHTRKDGSVFDVDISINAAWFGGKKLIFCICRDITARKQAEKALRQSEERYRALFDNTLVGTIVIDAETMKVTMANQAAAKIFGFSSVEESIGADPLDFFHANDKELARKLIERELLEQDLRTTHELRTITKDGREIWISVQGARIVHEGRLAGLLSFTDITQRKKAEEALDLQRTYFQQLFESSPDAVLMIDMEGRVIQVNKGFEMLFGYSNEEAKGQSFIELIVPQEDAQDASQSLRRVLSGATVRKERSRRRKDGSLADVSTVGYPIRFNGGVVGAYLIYTDISERKKMEEALRNSEEKLRGIFESVTDGICVIDLKGTITELNQRTVDIHGFSSREELVGKNAFELVSPGDHQRIATAVKKAIKQEAMGVIECTLLKADGSEFPGELSISALKDASGNLTGHVSLARDITERKKMEEALKQAAKEWKETFDSITDAISIHDRDFRIRRANKAFADMFGVDVRQVVGKHCYKLHKGEKPKSGCPHQQTLATGKPAAAEFYESHLKKYLRESTSPIFNEKGEVIGTVHITRDVTEQKLQNERLTMADRLASLGELVAGTAHELNNPLTSIIGFSQLLRERDIPDDLRKDVELIYSEAQRAANVTKNLLTFARKHTPLKQLTQINNIIEDVLKLRAYELKVNNIEVQKQLAPDLPEIMVDPLQMQQVFLNIIINAEYFMTEAHNRGTLTITTKRQNDNVMISIADDGPGIPPENLGRIFDPFFTTKPIGKGTGLGLSICHGIVTEHGGQIYARSQLGQGATLVVELPVS